MTQYTKDGKRLSKLACDSTNSWLDALLVYFKPKVLTLFFLGFSSGLPYLLVFSTLTAWLRDNGVERSTIGFVGFIGMVYSLKVLWSPFVDRIQLPLLGQLLGQRRAWMLFSQVGIIASLVAMAMVKPGEQLILFALLALCVAFFSATQDIVVDAFRIDSAQNVLQGAMATTYILGYRIALLFSGAGALYIADISNWTLSYFAMAGAMSVGLLTTLCVNEPQREVLTPHNQPKLYSRAWFYQVVILPFVEFFQRYKGLSLLLLAFISIFRISDIVMGVMANVFYLDLGFSKTDIASIAKLFGFSMTLLGSFVGGIWVARFGVHGPLIVSAILVVVTNLLFAQLSLAGANKTWLIITISADNLSGGFATVAFIAYLSSLTNRYYSATQYALFSSIMTLPGKFISGFSGSFVDSFGYVAFFIYSSAIGIPSVVLAIILYRMHQQKRLE